MGQAVFDASSYEVEGEELILTTTEAFVALKQGFQEVSLHCPNKWKLALTPALLHCLLYSGSDLTDTANYTEYKGNVTDKSSSTNLPLGGMTSSDKLYIGTSQQIRAFWVTMGSSKQSTGSRTLDVNYHKQITLTAFATSDGGAKTEVTSSSHGMSNTDIVHIRGAGQYNGSWAVESVAGNTFVILKAYFDNPATGTGVFLEDVANDSDGTSSTTTLDQSGLYEFDLPTTVRMRLGTIAKPLFTECYWTEIIPNDTLSATVDVDEIIPAYRNTNYKVKQAGIEYQISLNPARVGGLEVLSAAGTPTLDIGWIKS